MSGASVVRYPGAGIAAWIVLVFLYLPIATLIVLSFNENDLITIWTGFSLRWYAAVAGNADMVRAARNSLVVAGWSAGLGTVLATMMAFATHRADGPARRIAEAVVSLPILVPEIVTAVALLMLFVQVGVDLGLTAIVLAHTVFCIPFAFYPIRARLAALDPALSEAAADLYAGPVARFLRIELPLLAPGIAAGAMLAFISSLGDFVVAYFVSGPGTTTLPVYVFGMIRVGITPDINALSALLLLVSIVLIAVAFAIGRYADMKTEKGGSA